MRKRKVTVSLIVLWIFIAAAFVPLYVMLTGSLKPNMALYLIPPDLNPFTLTLENYSYVFTKLRLGLWYGNSLFISLMITVITVAVSATAGYAFAKKEFVGKKLWFAVLLATMMLPRQILMVPNFLVAKNFHLVDTLMGVVLTSIAAPFGVFLCKQFMSTLPGRANRGGAAGRLQRGRRLYTGGAAPVGAGAGSTVHLQLYQRLE